MTRTAFNFGCLVIIAAALALDAVGVFGLIRLIGWAV